MSNICSKCNIGTLTKQILKDSCNKRIGNNYICNVRIITTCDNCNYVKLEFDKHITEVDI